MVEILGLVWFMVLLYCWYAPTEPVPKMSYSGDTGIFPGISSGNPRLGVMWNPLTIGFEVGMSFFVLEPLIFL